MVQIIEQGSRDPDDGAQIFTGRALRERGLIRGPVLPTAAEYRKLLATVTGAYPVLRPAKGETEERFIAAFVSCFRRVAELPRGDRLDTGRSLSWWLDDTDMWLAGAGIHCRISGLPFIAALIASGDIGFAPLDRYPFDLAFGLRPGSTEHFSTAWRAVLSGAVPSPKSLPRQQVQIGAVPVLGADW